MAWTDTCRIEAVKQVDHHIKQGKTVRDALTSVSKESDIPPGTLKRWKYPDQSVPKNGNTKERKRSPKKIAVDASTPKVWTQEDVHKVGMSCFYALIHMAGKIICDSETKIDTLLVLKDTLEKALQRFSVKHHGSQVSFFGAEDEDDVLSLLEELEEAIGDENEVPTR